MGSLHKKKVCSELKECNSRSQLELKESEFGIRYSVIIDFSLFDPVSFVAVDPMHNLLLGSAKHVAAIWIKHGILSHQSLAGGN